ncbi:type II toxin-antitoxin system HicA family toxin [Alkalimonas sp.]|uniref:type II toxin-antitoxin system HicA family toxin n=1 Tax=Alkalimonas sp. TaxID=1872453 RepID=UPI00263AD723|nr:type II toxin-antitoxin system HicA family toxin [Alkalimonas sp.]MCC5824699.1 type II toxin-antitoxin system HicA family toxin [Alkalimonas sp.]
MKSALERAGFAFVHQKGSHEKWAKTDKNGKRYVVTVDCPKAPFSDTLVKSMAAQAGMSKRELLKLCHEKKHKYSEANIAVTDD